MNLPLSRSFDDNYSEYKYDTDFELAEKITQLAGKINVANYHFLKILAEIDRRESWRIDNVRSCSAWLSLYCGMSASTAREKLRVAHCLERLPEINEAFENSGVSYSKVRAMTRVATDDNEKVLLNFALSANANQMDKLVRKYQRVDENQNPIEQGDEHQQRKFTYYQDEEGMWVFKGKLEQLEGGLFVKALEEIIRQQDKLLIADKKKNDSAGALPEVQENELIVEKATYRQKNADALGAMAEHFIATATTDDENGGIQALAGHERCQCVLHLNVDSLKAEHEHGDNCNCGHLTPHYMDDHWISPTNAKRFSCDASLYSVLEDTYGNILNLNRKARVIVTALRRALNIRDKTCRFPGCCANKYVDFHHIQHWGDLGETEPDNLIKLCRYHHALLHKGSYNIIVQEQTKKNHGQKWIFKTAAGKVIEPNPTLPIPESADFLETQWPINTKSKSQPIGPRRKSEAMDYPQALKDMLWFKCQQRAGFPKNK